MSIDEKAKLRFDLANANLQSISSAQGHYVTALLIYLCLVWMTVFDPPKEATTIHMLWLDLRVQSIWKITSFVTMFLTLAISGTLNAARSAYTELKAAAQRFFGEEYGTLFHIDTQKNLLDYLELLQVNPTSITRMPVDSHGTQSLPQRLRHLIFPALYFASWVTSAEAVGLAFSGSRSIGLLIFGIACLTIQALFSIRPVYRFVTRMLGADRSETAYQ